MKPDYENRIDGIISRKYKARLMNNTKWREVFTCLVRLDIRFYIVWIDGPASLRSPPHRVFLDDIDERGLGDSRIGGPFYYKEIHAVRVPRVLRMPKLMRGQVDGYEESEQEVGRLLEELHQMGQFPLNETDDYVEIYGYV